MTSRWHIIGMASDFPAVDTPEYDYVSLSGINSDYATVDNDNYYYYLEIYIPHASTSVLDYRFFYALIEYELPAYQTKLPHQIPSFSFRKPK